MKTIYILFAITGFLFISCGQAKSNQNTSDVSAQVTATVTPKPAYDQSLAKGKITDSVICQYLNNQSYALYLPSYYTADKKFPCIYFFDAHARGLLPVRLCKVFAEKYGFVVIGSNVSKNGMQWPETEDIVKSLMNDSRARISIDPQRIYTSGFSGGARVASTVAIQDGGIAGVISCAAGFPRVQQAFQNKFDYFGLVGVYDFNLSEVADLDVALQQNGFTHQLLTFEGKHEWPQAAEMQTAFLWLQVNAMKENLQPKNDTIINGFKNDYDKRITAAKSSGELLKEHDLLEGLVRTLSGLQDISSYKKQSDDLANSSAYKNAISLQTQLRQTEATQQQEFQQQFATQSEAWWAKKIAAIKQNIHSAKTKQESQMDQRMLNFLGLVGYLNSNHALNTNDLTNAATYLKTFKMADPKNPDCGFLSAIYYMKKGDQKQAFAALNEAVSLGYSDISLLQSDPSFTSLHGNAAFENLATKVKENTSKRAVN